MGRDGFDADIDEPIARFANEGRAAWPGLHVDVAEFVRFVAKRLPQGDVEVALASLNPGGLYLACACSRGNSDAIAALEAAYFADCDGALARMANGSGFADEVKQRVREKLFVAESGDEPRIATYGGRGDLRTFVRVVMMRQAISLRRRKDREVPLESGSWPWASADPELVHLREQCGAEFERAFREAVKALSSEERNLLRYHYLDGLTIDHLGAIYGLHRASAARRLTKVRATLVEATRRMLAERLKLRTGELESVLRLIEGEVDVSLRRVLGDAHSRV
ncbi:sigma-70 family RNA polymerase sigma factor [Pendulispora rubella]|uniref:Sigma-70 family RNA polymerase sigma factor n=1 Tax=Pendulispora rubella TaxID=2741070 RepID=A0ABZ2KRV4_9BACT